MKRIHKAAAAAIVAALGAAALAPTALAHDWRGGPGGQHERGALGQSGEGGMHMRIGLLGLACSTDGAAQLEQMLTGLSERLDLTAEQQPLFDAMQASALTAQTGFADTCTGLVPPTAATAEQPDMLERMQTRIKVDEARLAAMNEVLPALEAFYGSLTDEQKQQLDDGPRFGGRFGDRDGPQGGPGKHRMFMHRNG